ncbi:MAG: carbohydrate-binding domain-containing protein [Bacteroidales bacterium]|jgi:hypothetical protein|nr:carbohydrate-binding domain-containing protein [Bacteroidales bacterium]MCI2121804.1 carbohydrate-binding domain-containing protein [Bacteroidales bacterium]MCI2144670.1 carbohydrate-binding domain-containing protein [Bacteroidales bacterium]
MKAKIFPLSVTACSIAAMMLAFIATSCITDKYQTDDNSDTTSIFEVSSQVKISYSGNSAIIDGGGDSIAIATDGAHITVTSTAEGVSYMLSGTTSDGSFKIYSAKSFQLTLDGVSITSESGAAINSQSSKKCVVTLPEGTTNTLCDASSYNTPASEDEKGCLFSEGQLVFSGGGSLKVTGNHKNGICSDEYVIIEPGTSISITKAANDGIHAKEYFLQNGGDLSVTASSDGIDCEDGYVVVNGGSTTVSTDGTAKKCIKAETYVDINGGTLDLATSGDGKYDSDDDDVKGAACIKSGTDFTFDNAGATLKSTGKGGKGINADGKITIDGGTLNVTTTGKEYSYGSSSTGAKGIKCDGEMTFNGGDVTVSATGGDDSEGIESKSTIVVNDGTINVTAYDDAMNASTNITVNGGRTFCYSSGNDGIDSNGSFLFTEGLTIAVGTTTPEDGFDCDQNNFAITGGILLGFGGSTSTPTANSCSQKSVIYGSVGKSLVAILDSDGNCLFTYDLSISYSSAVMLYSSPSLSGGTYTIYTGGAVNGGTSLGNYTTGGTYSGGSKSSSFKVSGTVTTVGSFSSGGGAGGGHGGGRP